MARERVSCQVAYLTPHKLVEPDWVVFTVNSGWAKTGLSLSYTVIPQVPPIHQ
jgi:hypothetical protein